MKKILTLVLAVVLVMGLATTAFAENPITTKAGKDEQAVKATYTKGLDGGIVYSVDVAWGSLVFKYTSAAKGTWQPATHTYANTAAEKWECAEGANEIKVTNHSNAAVDVTVNYAQATGYTAVTGTVTGGTGNLAAGEVGKPDQAANMTATLTLSGSLPQSETEVTVGTVTVALS